MSNYPIKKIKQILQDHWSEIMTELDSIIDIDYITVDMKVKYEDMDEGFELGFNDIGGI